MKNNFTENTRIRNRTILLVAAVVIITAVSLRMHADTGSCGGASITLPFTDVPNTNTFFCSIAEAFFSGLSNGTSATTYSPGDFDGARVWTANLSGSVYIVTLNPLTVSTVTAGFNGLAGILYDGVNIWITNQGSSPGTLLRLDSNGAILQTVDVGIAPEVPVFDGTNIWVPNSISDTVTVVRASTGAVLATLTGNGLSGPYAAAFDGERVLVTSPVGNVSLWKAADLSPLGFVSTGSSPFAACSDGLNFWITQGGGTLARF